MSRHRQRQRRRSNWRGRLKEFLVAYGTNASRAKQLVESVLPITIGSSKRETSLLSTTATGPQERAILVILSRILLRPGAPLQYHSTTRSRDDDSALRAVKALAEPSTWKLIRPLVLWVLTRDPVFFHQCKPELKKQLMAELAAFSPSDFLVEKAIALAHQPGFWAPPAWTEACNVLGLLFTLPGEPASAKPTPEIATEIFRAVSRLLARPEEFSSSTRDHEWRRIMVVLEPMANMISAVPFTDGERSELHDTISFGILQTSHADVAASLSKIRAALGVDTTIASLRQPSPADGAESLRTLTAMHPGALPHGGPDLGLLCA